MTRSRTSPRPAPWLVPLVAVAGLILFGAGVLVGRASVARVPPPAPPSSGQPGDAWKMAEQIAKWSEDNREKHERERKEIEAQGGIGPNVR